MCDSRVASLVGLDNDLDAGVRAAPWKGYPFMSDLEYIGMIPTMPTDKLIDDLSEYAGYDPYYFDFRKALFAEVRRRFAQYEHDLKIARAVAKEVVDERPPRQHFRSADEERSDMGFAMDNLRADLAAARARDPASSYQGG